MKLNIVHPKEKNRHYLTSSIRGCMKRADYIGGFPYIDPIVNGKLQLSLIVPEGTNLEKCKDAITYGCRRLSALRHSVIVCPKEWFECSKQALLN